MFDVHFLSPKGGFQFLGILKCTKIKSYNNKSYVVNSLALAGAAMGCSSMETVEVATGFSIFTSDSILFGVGLIHTLPVSKQVMFLI